VEHAAWVLFEDAILFVAIRRMRQEMHEIALRRATLEGSNVEIERQVVERTAELNRTQAELLETSRLAGMAEVATSVLHNVGNVLQQRGGFGGARRREGQGVQNRESEKCGGSAAAA
jgi:C4-dicarboxylate-specific signal transduction histidine kinase